MRYCGGSLPWLKSHTWPSETVYTGAIEEAEDGSLRWTGDLTALRVGDPMWTRPLTFPGVENPALGPGRPNLIFAVVDGDLFAEVRPKVQRPKEDINRVCRTLAASKHIGLLCTKYTSQMAAFFGALDPRTVRRWQPKLLLGFSAERQKWFDQRWANIRPLADTGWFVFVALSPLLESVTLPPDFVALGQRTWVVVYGECNRWESERCRPLEANYGCVQSAINVEQQEFHSSCGECTRARISRPDLTNLREFPVWP